MKGLFYSSRQLPVIMQAETSECGLACLAMVLAFHGHRIDLNTLRSRIGGAATGTTLSSLMQMADRMQLAPRPLRLELDEVGALQLPAILHWDLKHFVVLKEVKKKHLYLHDPAKGEVVLSLNEANGHFTGVALELMPIDGFRPRDERRVVHLRDLWQRSEGLWKALGQLLLLSSLIQLFALALPFYTQLFIDDVLVNRDYALLKIMATGFFMVAVVRSLTEFLRTRAVLHLGNLIGLQIAANVCRHLLRLPLSWFARRHPGDVLARFGALGQIKDFLCSGIVEVAIDGLMVTGTLTLMWVYSRLLTAVALVSVVV
ncbi:MAG TPA: cysteine peptidase family C39 domain-containing protein, partial [Candidatus Acidoferrum sp.]|nr:cysteine peptidase family C39 domain-containing protein [Candidatus Acidoferrum sp.]